MKNLYLTISVLLFLISSVGFAKNISMQGLTIKLVDINGATVSNYPVQISATYSYNHYHFSCLFNSGVPTGSASLKCLNTEYSYQQSLASDGFGLIDLNSVSYSVRNNAQTMYINLRFAGSITPNCDGLNVYTYTDRFSNIYTHLNQSILFDQKLITALKAKNNGQISCILK